MSSKHSIDEDSSKYNIYNNILNIFHADLLIFQEKISAIRVYGVGGDGPLPDHIQMFVPFIGDTEWEQYLHIIEKLEWPLYFIKDKGFVWELFEKYRSNKEDAIIHIKSYINKSFINIIVEKWNIQEVVSQDRLNILDDAIIAYKAGHYCASICILMCQLYGILQDIDEKMKIQGISKSYSNDDIFRNFCDRLISEKDSWMHTEKFRTVRLFFYPAKINELYMGMAKYIKDTILTSEDRILLTENPNRNKICHGIQMNIRTESIAIKSILAIDILINMGDIILRGSEDISADLNIQQSPEALSDAVGEDAGSITG